MWAMLPAPPEAIAVIGDQIFQRPKEKLLLVSEVDVERAAGDPGCTGHSLNREVLERTSHRLLEGRRNQLLPGTLVAAAAVMSSLQ